MYKGLGWTAAEHSWNTTEFSMTEEMGVTWGVARAITREGSWITPATS